MMRFVKALLLLLLSLVALASVAAFAADGPRKVKEQIAPVYPEMAKTMNLSGAVRLEILVTPQGTVKSTKVLGGHPVLADAAVRAVKYWKYEPGPEETINVTLNFKP